MHNYNHPNQQTKPRAGRQILMVTIQPKVVKIIARKDETHWNHNISYHTGNSKFQLLVLTMEVSYFIILEDRWTFWISYFFPCIPNWSWMATPIQYYQGEPKHTYVLFVDTWIVIKSYLRTSQPCASHVAGWQKVSSLWQRYPSWYHRKVMGIFNTKYCIQFLVLKIPITLRCLTHYSTTGSTYKK